MIPVSIPIDSKSYIIIVIGIIVIISPSYLNKLQSVYGFHFFELYSKNFKRFFKNKDWLFDVIKMIILATGIALICMGGFEAYKLAGKNDIITNYTADTITDGKKHIDNSKIPTTENLEKLNETNEESIKNYDSVNDISNENFVLTHNIRLKGEKIWHDYIDAKVGDIIELQIGYKNTSHDTVRDVMVQVILPNNIEYVSESTKLKNGNYPNGVQLSSETLTTTGINIGGYTNGSNAYILFSAKVVNKSQYNLNKEINMISWAKITAGETTDSKKCEVFVKIDRNGVLQNSNTVYSGWGDSNGGRLGYTMERISKKILEDKVVFNSITNPLRYDKNGLVHKIADERNFVHAREANTDNAWDANEIIIEDGKEYRITMYIHNNNPNGYNAIGYDTKASFSIPGNTSNRICVNGYITCSNAIPNKYWDGVVFASPNNELFHLEVISDSGLWETNGKSYSKLSNDLITEDGVLVGFDSLDGRIPGGEYYSGYASIAVIVIFD